MSTKSYGPGNKLRWRRLTAIFLSLALLGVACNSETATTSEDPGGADTLDATPSPDGANETDPSGEDAGVPTGEPELDTVRIGISVADSAYLPIYIGERHTCEDRGLELELLTFQGDAETNQALFGGATDLNVQSLTGPMNAINAGQAVKVFYAGMNSADFAWVAQPEIGSWEELRGRSIGVTTYGSLTDTLTRYVLRQHDIEPEEDIRMVQAGGSPTSWPTIREGALDAGILSMNYWLEAEAEGFTILGNQLEEIAPSWPKEVFTAPDSFIEENPKTITALLQCFADAVLMLKDDKDLAVEVLVDQLDYEPERAGQVYDFIESSFHADGRMAEEALPVFWELQEELGNVDHAWEPEEYMVTDWLDTYEQWGPEGS